MKKHQGAIFIWLFWTGFYGCGDKDITHKASVSPAVATKEAPSSISMQEDLDEKKVEAATLAPNEKMVAETVREEKKSPALKNAKTTKTTKTTKLLRRWPIL